ncbi:MAG: hypothetical protein GY861_28150 [bacterium]|nr:hypothetical protein [bacterium]
MRAKIRGGEGITICADDFSQVDASESYDPSNPTNPLVFDWTVSSISIEGAYFNYDIPSPGPSILEFDRFTFEPSMVITVELRATDSFDN